MVRRFQRGQRPLPAATTSNVIHTSSSLCPFSDPAFTVSRRMLAIDPEDALSWFWVVQALKEGGAPEELAAAEAACDRFRPDDDMDVRRGRFLLADPHLERMAQPIHVHLAPGLTEGDR